MITRFGLVQKREDMTLEQVAQAAGENLNTVKSRLYRALGKLRIALEET